MSGSKTELRRALLKGRRAMGSVARAEASRRIGKRINRLRQFKSGARVALYLPVGSEADTTPVIRAAKRRGIQLYVPLVIDLPRRRMRFVRLNGDIKPGIDRTSGNTRNLRFVAPRWFNLMLIPVVGIDSIGHRLGMGAGFYDRALAFRRLRTRWMGPRLVALSFDCQRVGHIHRQSWDARLDTVVTESGLENFSQGDS